ncbi:SA1362 family protein [Bacillus sp. Marseille-P3661]|uniref:SA1362 family protein n=1 Tax=Bacillus sp. Marseille-P3661 TaxID=1936234 RepID=UPI000C8455B2|nr:SA1362 family protein [Bacillus sp. Marseille-P3661]
MFNRPSVHPLIMVIIGLAGFGLLYRLVVNPVGLIKEILIAALVIGIIFLIYKLVMQKRFGATGHLNSKYKRAVRQSKKLYNETSTHTTKVRGLSQQSAIKKPLRSAHTHKSSKKREHNFTVIDGKKGKKKNRAFF